MAKIHLTDYSLKADLIGSKTEGNQYIDIEVKLNFDSIGNMEEYMLPDGTINKSLLLETFRKKMSVMYDKHGSISLD